MLNLHWKKVTLLTFCFLYSLLSYSQMKGSYNYLDFANKPYYFGMRLAVNTSQYKVVHGQNFIQNDSIYSVESLRGPGFSLGGIFNLKVGKYFDFRISPTFSLSDRSLVYKMVEDQDDLLSKRFDPVFLELPFHIRYKSAPYKDIRAFVIAGVNYSFDAASNSRARQAATLVKIAPSDFAIEYGVGMQMFFPYFIFSPEFKVSHGITNILISDNELIFSSVLDKLMSRAFTLSFNFEG